MKCLRDVDKYVIVLLCGRVTSELEQNVAEAASKEDWKNV